MGDRSAPVTFAPPRTCKGQSVREPSCKKLRTIRTLWSSVGGLAGLAVAAYLARGGLAVTLLERSEHLGGRARTRTVDGYCLNLGAHALYRAGEAAGVYRELGIPYPGGAPQRGGACPQ